MKPKFYVFAIFSLCIAIQSALLAQANPPGPQPGQGTQPAPGQVMQPGMDGKRPLPYPEFLFGTAKDTNRDTAKKRAVINALEKGFRILTGEVPQNLLPKMRNLLDKLDQKNVIKDIKENSVQKEGNQFVVEMRLKIDWNLLADILKKEGFTIAAKPGNVQQPPVENSPQGKPMQPMQPQPGMAETPGALQSGTSADWGSVSEEEKNVLLKYLDTMTYMVYYNENSLADKAMLKAAVSQANTVLTKAGITVLNIDQIEKLKGDYLKVLEDSSGEQLSLVQWIAQKLNADVYVQLDVVSNTENSTSTEKNTKTVGILTTEMYDSSTAQLLGSVALQIIAKEDKPEDTTNLVLNVVNQAMTQAVLQAKQQMQKTLVRGIRYEVIVQKTPDSRLMNKFVTELQKRVKQLKVISSNSTEYRLEVYYIGMLTDLEALVYNVTDLIPGLENMAQVMASGKSIIFNTNL